MSSIEKAMDRFNKTTKYSSGDLDIDFALTESVDKKTGSVPPVATNRPDTVKAAFASNKPHYSFNYNALSQQGFLTPNSERNSVAEEYRSLKRPILMNAFGKGAVPVERGNLVMVVSAEPGEGKTFSAFNLAMSMAMERDKTVLLVDSDVVRSTLTKMLGMDNQLGLLDVLKDKHIQLNDVIVNTDLPNFSILPAGKAQMNSTELLASEEMERVAADLSSRYSDRIILFDAPPILATTESIVLAHLMGQIVMVVEAGKTLQNVVTTALSQLDQDKVIGLLLNKCRRGFRSEYYGGYGYYGK